MVDDQGTTVYVLVVNDIRLHAHLCSSEYSQTLLNLGFEFADFAEYGSEIKRDQFFNQEFFLVFLPVSSITRR